MGEMGPPRDLGPTAVVWGGAEVGETFGGTNFRHSQDTTPVREDRYGNTDVDQIFIGDAVEVETRLSRLSLANLASVLPGASGSGTVGDQMVVRSVVGRSMYARAQTLILKPIVESATSTDATEWTTIFKAYPRVDLDVVYDVTTQRVYRVFFTGFRVQADATGMKTGWLYKLGSNA